MHGQNIYKTTGVALLPWQVFDFPDDWYSAILALDELARKEAIINRVKGIYNGKSTSHH
jgi:hypothetical protein